MPARKTVLPSFVATDLADAGDPDAIQVTIPPSSQTAGGHYFVRPQRIERESFRRDGKPTWMPHRFNLYPVVLDADGVPWAEANMWILDMLEGVTAPSMATYASIAEDLAGYRRFLDETGVEWLHFPTHKLQRPTYRFNGHLKHLIQNDEIAPSTAKRRMATVIRFYRWLQEEEFFAPANAAWKASDRFVEFTDLHGLKRSKTVITTDVSIRVTKQENPYDGTIDDGGKLRPLPQEEQEWLLDALLSLGNTEMTLIHLFGLLTGARIQTVLTFRLKHALLDTGCTEGDMLRLPVGPGTGIDTKNNKKLVIHIPLWFHRMLRTYALSDRAKGRRARAAGGDGADQYLFLSIRGAPLYTAEGQVFDAANTVRHAKVGQGVRQYIKERIIPFIRATFGVPSFHYRFHDTRATFGMNLVDEWMKLVETGQATLKDVMDFVQARMGHTSSATTERYLNYRSRLKLVRAAQDGWEARLEELARRAMEGG
ncbi:MAG TPA: hypothetical protein VJ576_13430 [Rhodocyclaceae bacterium]|nr:hypothetical protein [Rhodocyclaceae bacterium]